MHELTDMIPDYIHCRYMVGSIADWPGLTQKIYEYVEQNSVLSKFEGSNNYST